MRNSLVEFTLRVGASKDIPVRGRADLTTSDQAPKLQEILA